MFRFETCSNDRCVTFYARFYVRFHFQSVEVAYVTMMDRNDDGRSTVVSNWEVLDFCSCYVNCLTRRAITDSLSFLLTLQLSEL